MNAWRDVQIDFAQPQRTLWHWRVALLLGAAVSLTILFELGRVPHLQPTSDTPVLASGAEAPIIESAAQRGLANDLTFFQRSFERTLPAGVELLSVSAAQDTGEVTLTVQSSSAEKILALPAWLEPDAAQRRWRVQQLSARSAQTQNATLTGVLSCSGCWAVAQQSPVTQ